MTGEMAVMDATGDTKTIWDKDKPDEVEMARETFKKLTGKGYSAWRVKDGGKPGEKMREFDASAEQIILTPPVAGG